MNHIGLSFIKIILEMSKEENKEHIKIEYDPYSVRSINIKLKYFVYIY